MQVAVKAIRNNPRAEAIQRRSYQLMWALVRSTSSKYKEGCVQEADVELAFESMMSMPDADVVHAQALGFLWSVATLGRQEKTWFFLPDRKTGAIGMKKIITSLSHHIRSPEVQKNGLEVLRSLCLLGKERRKMIFEAGGANRAVDAMTHHGQSRAVIRQAMAVFGNLAAGIVSVRRELFTLGAPERILAAIVSDDRDEATAMLGCWALGNLIGVSRKRARNVFELGGKKAISEIITEFAANDHVKNYGSLVIKRLEMVEDMNIRSVDMDEDEEEITTVDLQNAIAMSDTAEGQGDEQSDKESSSSSEEDPELLKQMQELAEQTGGLAPDESSGLQPVRAVQKGPRKAFGRITAEDSD
eukprot:TRINITY_DN42255_c0_g1_i1.p1 TRINITY_DN42255_c0_g1~~TRINITY_DN42255_c0_g1_i1.p1  ORF type:complete len:404 (+),score=75.99 TRINITY_DN42255_c0_g1_i1:141-1214(+)